MKFTILLILLLPLFVFAGERGFYVVAIDLVGGFWDTQYYKNYLDSDSEPAPCWEKRAGNGIAVFARKKIPIEITVDMVKSVVEGNKESISKMKKFLDPIRGLRLGPVLMDCMRLIISQDLFLFMDSEQGPDGWSLLGEK